MQLLVSPHLADSAPPGVVHCLPPEVSQHPHLTPVLRIRIQHFFKWIRIRGGSGSAPPGVVHCLPPEVSQHLHLTHIVRNQCFGSGSSISRGSGSAPPDRSLSPARGQLASSPHTVCGESVLWIRIQHFKWIRFRYSGDRSLSPARGQHPHLSHLIRQLYADKSAKL
jgi:hypothetical protein